MIETKHMLNSIHKKLKICKMIYYLNAKIAAWQLSFALSRGLWSKEVPWSPVRGVRALSPVAETSPLPCPEAFGGRALLGIRELSWCRSPATPAISSRSTVLHTYFIILSSVLYSYINNIYLIYLYLSCLSI